MGIIKILDTHTINKIAAGEVVERPFSVVKELVENSIDAKASSITIEIKNGGLDFMRITDNGVGIPKEEVEIAFLRHATSKIVTSEDLQSVMTLGFRGEALASIAAISQVEFITKTSSDMTGKRVEVGAGKLQSSEEIACPEGTTIIVRHLFYNVPARREFLKSPGVEASKIQDHLYKLALAHPEISFRYIQNNKLIFSTSGNNDIASCIFNIYGKETAKNIFQFYHKENNIEFVGAIGNTSLTRSNRNYEHFFINGRAIRSYLLQRATEDAYKTLVMVGKFPFVVIHLKLDPTLVDVNVHPNKLEVRFKNEEEVYEGLYHGLCECLGNVNLIPRVTLEKTTPSLGSYGPPKEQENVQLMTDTFFTARKETNGFEPRSMVSSPVEVNKKERSQEERLFGKPHVKVEEVTQEELEDKSSFLVKEREHSIRPDYHIIGKLFNTYWLIKYGEKVFIMDQHAAHERVMYEQFMSAFKRGTVSRQILLIPETIRLTPSEIIIFEENAELFSKLGFLVEVFGESSVVIREVPFLLNNPLPAHLFKDILDKLSSKRPEDISEVKEDSIIQLSCKKAVKAHDNLSNSECESLISSLFMLENPFTCPHGRPVLIAITEYDIEKMFKRV